jgi:hypothetical protein
VGAALTVHQEWSRVPGPEESVERYDITDLDTGERTVLHLAGDVLISREGQHPAHLLGLTD